MTWITYVKCINFRGKCTTSLCSLKSIFGVWIPSGQGAMWDIRVSTVCRSLHALHCNSYCMTFRRSLLEWQFRCSRPLSLPFSRLMFHFVLTHCYSHIYWAKSWENCWLADTQNSTRPGSHDREYFWCKNHLKCTEKWDAQKMPTTATAHNDPFWEN